MSYTRKEPLKNFHARVPADLFEHYKTICVNHGISFTEGLIFYFEYLKKQTADEVQLLREETLKDFSLRDNLR